MTTILIKKKDTAGAPVAGDLTNAAGGAEIAVNTATKRIYTKDSGGNVVEVGTFPSSMAVQGNLSATGNVTLGDASADNVTVNGTITSSLLFTDATYDIGASGANRPRDLFLSRNLTVGGTLVVTGGINFNGNVTVGDSSADTLTINSTITSNLLFTDNTYSIGASGANRPANLYVAATVTLGSTSAADQKYYKAQNSLNVAEFGIFPGGPAYVSSNGDYDVQFFRNGGIAGAYTSLGLSMGGTGKGIYSGTGSTAITFSSGTAPTTSSNGSSICLFPSTDGTFGSDVHFVTGNGGTSKNFRWYNFDGSGFNLMMRLDSSGNATVTNSITSGSGTTAGNGDRIAAYGSTGTINDIGIALYDNTAGQPIKLLRTGTSYSYAGMGGSEAALYTYSSQLNLVADGGNIKFNTGTAGAASERGRFATGGTFLVGTTTLPTQAGVGVIGATAHLYVGTMSQNINYGNGISLGNAGKALLLQQSINTNDERVYLTNNAQTSTSSGFTGSFTYNKAGANASAYITSSGYHSFYSAPVAANAGDAITWTSVFAVGKDVSIALQGAANQSGTGITFPGTANLSTNANTLDDYEEGTFDVVLQNNAGTQTVTFSGAGKYTKIGRFISYQTNIYNASVTAIGAGEPLRIVNLPFSVGYYAATGWIGSYPGVPVSVVDGAGTTAPLYVPSNAVDYTFWTRNQWGGATTLTMRGQFTAME